MKKKFTLIELIIVIVVIGLLAAMALPKVNGIVKNAKISAMINDKEVLEKTMLLYYQKYDELPLLNENQELIVLNNNISLVRLVQAEEVINEDMTTIYTSLQETLKHYNDSEENLYRIDMSKIKESLSKKLKYGYKETDKDFYVYSTKTNNVYYYKPMINGNGKIQHSEFNTTLKTNELVDKKVSINLNENFINENPIIVEDNTFAVGNNHIIKIDDNGDIYSWGYNEYGKLGIGSTTNQTTPQKVTLPNGVKAKSVYTRSLTSFAIGEDDNLYSWGCNEYGQLGVGNTTNQTIPTKVKLPEGIKIKIFITCRFNTMIVTEDNELYSWGLNNYGQLGVGNTTNQTIPQKVNIPNGEKISDIYLGFYHTVIMGSNNNVYTCGYNKDGELGLGHTNNQTTLKLVTLPNGVKPISVYAGEYHSTIVSEDKKLYSCGLNNYGQLGIGSFSNSTTFKPVQLPDEVKVESIYVEKYDSMIIDNNGNLYSWGWNTNGQLGLNNKSNTTSPKLVLLPDNKKAKQIYLREYNSLILTEDNEVYMCGSNSSGQLGECFNK